MAAGYDGSIKVDTSIDSTGFNKGLKGVQNKFSGAVKAFGDSFKSLTGISLGAAGAIGLVGIGLQKGIKLTTDSIRETVEYNKTVRELTQVLGLNADETSRIIQVADDWGISIEDVRTSLQFMNKTGLTPSIDNLANMADEYVNSTDKAAWANEAVKTLGRGYSTLIPLLALGGKGFREAAAGIDKNLIATDDSIKASREYEVVIDNLDDAVKGLKYSIGNKLLPVLKDVIEIMMGTYDATEAAADGTTALERRFIELDSSIKETKEDIDKVVYFYHDFINVLKNGGKAHQTYAEYVDEASKAEKTYNGELAYSIGRSRELAKVTADPLTENIDELAQSELDAKNASDKLNQAYDDMNDAIDGQLGPSLEEFNKSQDEITIKMGEINSEINKLISDGMDPMSEEVLGLKGDYEELQSQYDTNATEHEKSTQRIMFGILEQRAAIGGLTEDELKYLDQISVSWGLVDQATLDYMADADESLNWLADHPGDVEGATKILNGQETSWSLAKREALLARDAASSYLDKLNEMDGKEVNTLIRTHYWEVYESGGGGRHRSGLNYTIPPGYPNDSFPLGRLGYAQSGERVVIIPRLATGAVIPPNAAFAAILGEQRRGINVEAPADLIRQIFREETVNMQKGDINIHFDGTMGELIRLMKPHIDRENRRIGNSLISGVTG